MALTPVVFAEVTARIDQALRRNAKFEKLFVVILTTLFLVGIGLMIGGVISQRWDCFVPGGLSEVAIIFPIMSLRKLIDDNRLFETFPASLLMANSPRSQQLLAQFLDRLIARL
jgi:uncharacterized membrane protein YbhN (UPF0104 family)